MILYTIQRGDTQALASAAQRIAALLSTSSLDITVDIANGDTSAYIRAFWIRCREIAAALRNAGQVWTERRVHDAVLMDIFGWVVEDEVQVPARTLCWPEPMTRTELQELLGRLDAWAAEQGV